MSTFNCQCDRCKKINQDGITIRILSGIPNTDLSFQKVLNRVKDDFAELDLLKKIDSLEFNEFYICRDCLIATFKDWKSSDKKSTIIFSAIFCVLAGLLIWFGISRISEGIGTVLLCFVPAGILIILALLFIYDTYFKKAKIKISDQLSAVEINQQQPFPETGELLIGLRGQSAVYFDEAEYQKMLLPLFATRDVLAMSPSDLLERFKDVIQQIKTPPTQHVCHSCGRTLGRLDRYQTGINLGNTPILYDGVICKVCGKIICSTCKGIPADWPCTYCGGEVSPAYENML